MSDDPTAILEELGRVIEQIYAGASRGVDYSPLFKSEGQPLIEKLKRVSSNWTSSENFHAAMDELEPWFVGDMRDRHRFQGNAVLKKLRHFVDEHDRREDQNCMSRFK